MTKPIAKKEHEVKPDKDQKGDKKSNPILTNIFVTSLVCLLFIGANYFLQAKLLKTQLKTVTASEDGINPDDAALNKPEKGIILDLGEFTMNLSDITPRRFLKISVAIEVTNPNADPKAKSGGGFGGGHGKEEKDPVVAEMEQYRPAIRDAIITVMTSKTSEDIAKTTGKELAKQEITDAVNDIFDGEREVMRVSFGEFIMQ